MTSRKSKDVVFDDVDVLVNYLYSQYNELTPIKLQKGLYFLYAYYGATYGETEMSEGILEEDFTSYPKKLFDEDFEAWTYGPVIRSVWQKQKAGYYNGETPELTGVKREVLLFINELFDQINSVSDFSLVDRSHEDKTWSTAYESKEEYKVLNKNDLIKEYKEKYTY